jgi:tetratricopeptide (TPR) repeat protein
MYGPESHEVSNCYFMMGSYFFENHEYHKSIACYMRTAELRGNMASDCYYNLGIIYQLLNQSKISLMMFKSAASMKVHQFGENSVEVGNIYHDIAFLYKSLGNYQSAIEYLQKVMMINSKDKNSEEYHEAKRTIEDLKDKIQEYKKEMDAKMEQKEKAKKAKTQEEIDIEKKKREKERERSRKTFMVITEELLGTLNAQETCYLAELQNELKECTTEFMAAVVVGKSNFLKKLKAVKFEHF